MEFTKAQVAALVLGYLKSEKLYSVVDEFTKCCSYFEDNTQHIKLGKYFVTRVGGKSLVDLLKEYALIYVIVQGRLEETNYYEIHSGTTLVQQLLYLLDQELVNLASSTPVRSVSSEVEATPAHTLPGNSYLERENLIPKTPKKRNKSRDKGEIFDVSEVLAQTLLDNHELHEKIAETINFVRNTPEGAKNVTDEHISAGASRELDAVIKTVIQRTEEDPVYNKLIDEMMCTTPLENPPSKKPHPCNTLLSLNMEEASKSTVESTNKAHSSNLADPIDDHNNAAIRSIIEASLNTDTPPTPPISESTNNGEVYVFDGSLDSYLKTSGATSAMNPNPVYYNPGGLIVMPPPETTSKQFYIVNNQPLINMNVSAVKGTVLTEKELMAIPTIIVNDESAPTVNVATKKSTRRTRILKPKITELETDKSQKKITRRGKTTKSEPVATLEAEPDAAQTTPSTATGPASRPASHVRNLDFSTPTCKGEPDKSKPTKGKAWDSDLRNLVSTCKDKSPSPKKKRPQANKKRKTKQEEEEKTEVEEREVTLMTPVKDSIPKTPGGEIAPPTSFHCTPFTDVLEEQLKGVDLTSIPTPSIPITPGFALTPGEIVAYNQRSTDYSTSSSYYQPSDNEQNQSINQLIEECRRLENTSPTQDKFSNLKILSDVVIEQAKASGSKGEAKKNCSDHLKKFNNNVIGKKNLSLLKRQPTTSSSSSDSDSEVGSEKSHSNKTVICKSDPVVKTNRVATINDIISTVEMKNTLDEETRKKTLLTQLEEKRQRTIQKIKNPPDVPKRAPRRPSAKTPKTTKKRNTKKKQTSLEDKEDEEAQKMVKCLAQRGIHLVPKKTPLKNKKPEKIEAPPEPDLIFDTRSYEDYETVIHNDKKKTSKTYDLTVLKKSMSAKVFLEDLNEEVTRIIKWSNCEFLLDFKSPQRKKSTQEIESELMDYVFMGSVREESGSKGGKKRKSRVSEDETKQPGKRNKAFDNIQLLKKIDVDSFLDKVHGE